MRDEGFLNMMLRTARRAIYWGNRYNVLEEFIPVPTWERMLQETAEVDAGTNLLPFSEVGTLGGGGPWRHLVCDAVRLGRKEDARDLWLMMAYETVQEGTTAGSEDEATQIRSFQASAELVGRWLRERGEAAA